MLDIALYNAKQHLQVRLGESSLVWCADRDDPSLWHRISPGDKPQNARLVEVTVTPGGVRLRVEGATVTLESPELTDSDPCDLKVPRELTLPVVATVAGTRFEIVQAAGTSHETSSPLEPLGAAPPASAHGRQHRGPAPATLTRWFESLAKLHRWSAGCTEFFAEAARFAVNPVGLDGAIVLRRDTTSTDGDWQVVASCIPRPELGVVFEPELLDRLVLSPQTWFHSGGSVPSAAETRRAVVIAPVLNAAGNLEGAVYGFRAVHSGNTRRGIRHLEARLVELLSQSVSNGMARLDQEVEAARRRATYEQVFAPSVAHQLELDAEALRGTEREITVLMADLRDFTSLCQNISTDAAYELLNDVMDCLTAAVMEHEGVLIDYFGDGLSAMWNAPVNQADHPELACNAALDMLGALPAVSHRWRHVLPQPLRLGIGIHTGPAKVGNIGSTQRLKYGPRGTTVNLASRLESATKLLGIPLVVTGGVAERLSPRLLAYRVCQGQLTGIDTPVDLFAVRHATTDEQVIGALDAYQRALDCYEEGNLPDACHLLHHRIACDDVPAEFLVHQIQLECARKLGRRAGDQPACQAGGPIELRVKD